VVLQAAPLPLVSKEILIAKEKHRNRAKREEKQPHSRNKEKNQYKNSHTSMIHIARPYVLIVCLLGRGLGKTCALGVRCNKLNSHMTILPIFP
jgi:hypothetical protein